MESQLGPVVIGRDLYGTVAPPCAETAHSGEQRRAGSGSGLQNKPQPRGHACKNDPPDRYSYQPAPARLYSSGLEFS